MIEVDTGYYPRPQQDEIHDNLKRFNVLVCHRRFGKTVLAINALIDAALNKGLTNPRYAYIAPLYKQAKTVAWDYLKHFSRPIPGRTINESELRIDYPNAGRIQLFGADNPDSLRGQYFDGVVVDEVAQCSPSLYGEVIRPTLADRKGWVLFIGTPKGHDHFFDLYILAKRDPDWYCKKFKASETGILDEDELNQAKKQMSESEYRQEFECDFDISSSFVLIPIQVIEGAFDRNVQFHGHPRIMGIDVGMSLGGDASAIVIRQGGKITDAIEFRFDDTFQIAGKVREMFYERHCSQGYIDSIGYGAGVAHTLKAWGLPITAINVAEKPADSEQFTNLKAELWWQTRDFFVDQTCTLPSDNDLMHKLAAELSTPEYEYTTSGKIKIQSKQDLFKLGKPSPNLADALVLTMNHATATAQIHPNQTELTGIFLEDYHEPEVGLI